MRVIFLDMDGVMNSRHFFMSPDYKMSSEDGFGLSFGKAQIDPLAVELLNDLVERSDAHIVISSSWRHIWDREEMGSMLESCGFKFKDRIIGETPRADMPHRGEEIKEWFGLDREKKEIDPDWEPVTSYVILDDDSDMLPEQHEHFVHTNPMVGLTGLDVQKALRILQQG